MNEEKKNIVRRAFQEAFAAAQDVAMQIETTTVNLNSNTQTRRFYTAKRKIIVPKDYKDLNEHDIRSICRFLSVSEMLCFRRVCKSTKLDVDKCKKQAANSIGSALMKRFELPQSLMDLVTSCEGVFTGSGLLSVFYDEHYSNMDVDVFLEAKHSKTVHTWLQEKQGTELIMDEDLQYLDHFEEIANKDSEAKRQFSTFTCRRATNIGEFALPPSLCPLQFIFLHSDKPKERAEKKFDISVLRNWFDGNKLHIGFQNDITSRTYTIQLKDKQKQYVCSEIPWQRIMKYKERGFTCRNIETRTCSRLFRDELYRFQLYFIDNHCFYTEVSVNGCVLIKIVQWLNHFFDTPEFVLMLKVAQSAGVPYSENCVQVFQGIKAIDERYKLLDFYF